MNTQAKLKQVTADLRAAHPELVQAGRWVFVTPLRHVQVGLLLDGSSDKTIFRPGTVLVPLFVPGCWQSRCFGEEIKRVRLDDPSAGKFVLEIYETHIAPFAQSIVKVDELHSHLDRVYTIEAAKSRKNKLITIYGVRFRAFILAALGRFDEARECVVQLIDSDRREREELQKYPENPLNQRILASTIKRIQAHENYLSVLRCGSSAIAKHLLEIEHEAVVRNRLEKYWQPSPFPFETAASER